jgi:hypothetical protein
VWGILYPFLKRKLRNFQIRTLTGVCHPKTMMELVVGGFGRDASTPAPIALMGFLSLNFPFKMSRKK